MNVDVSRLRKFRAEAEAAFAATNEIRKTYNNAGNTRAQIRLTLDREIGAAGSRPTAETQARIDRLRVDLSAADEAVAVCGDELVAAQQRSQLAGSLDRMGRDYAESLGLLPHDMRHL